MAANRPRPVTAGGPPVTIRAYYFIKSKLWPAAVTFVDYSRKLDVCYFEAAYFWPEHFYAFEMTFYCLTRLRRRPVQAESGPPRRPINNMTDMLPGRCRWPRRPGFFFFAGFPKTGILLYCAYCMLGLQSVWLVGSGHRHADSAGPCGTA